MLFVRTKVSPSAIKGMGLFADQDIKAGEKVWTFTPPYDFRCDPTDVNDLPEIARKNFLKYAFLSKRTGKYVLCFDDDRFFNHSDKPT